MPAKASDPAKTKAKTTTKARKTAKAKSPVELTTTEQEPKTALDLTPQDTELSGELMSSDDTEILSAFFKALADPSRLNIVFVLLKYKQLSVGDIAEKTKMSISAVSHQLAILRMRKLVTVKRDGVKNFYGLCDDHVSKVIEMAIEHIHED